MRKLKINDNVLTIDDTIEGVVKHINGDTITIETKDGFLIDFKSDELLNVTPKDLMNVHAININTIDKAIVEKTQTHKTITVKKKKAKTTLEVDLHLHQLIDNDRNMTNYDKLMLQLDTAKSKLNFAMTQNITKVIFVHGVGEGVLKQELENLLNGYENVSYYDADFKKYGFGATEVRVFKKPLKNVTDNLL